MQLGKGKGWLLLITSSARASQPVTWGYQRVNDFLRTHPTPRPLLPGGVWVPGVGRAG